MRLFVYICIACALPGAACTKGDTRTESVLYGTWINSNEPKDTLQFILQNRKNILVYNQTLNASAARDSVLFTYIKGKLAVALAGNDQPLTTIESFTWKEQNKVFDILGYQLYPSMSSSSTHFMYTKIK